jgi:hypothetical protein
MDDQLSDRTGGDSVASHGAKRFQIGLRLMLLCMALFCVLCAYYRAYSDLRREQIKEELITLDTQQRGLASMVKYNANVSPQRVAQLSKVNAEIAEKKRAIGEK